MPSHDDNIMLLARLVNDFSRTCDVEQIYYGVSQRAPYTQVADLLFEFVFEHATRLASQLPVPIPRDLPGPFHRVTVPLPAYSTGHNCVRWVHPRFTMRVFPRCCCHFLLFIIILELVLYFIFISCDGD